MLKIIGIRILTGISLLLFVPAVFVVTILMITGRAANAISEIVQEFNHLKAKETAKDVAEAGKVALGAGKVWMWASAPSTFTVIGAKLGIATLPAAYLLAPVLVAFTGAAITVSAALSLYSKWKSRRTAGIP